MGSKCCCIVDQCCECETETPDDWFTLKEAVESREVNLEEIATEEESPPEVSYLEETQMILSELQEKLQQPQNEVFAREFINSYREINSETQILNACANFGKDFKDDQNVTYVLMEEVPMGHS
ncbi:hypothetical protein CAPTEDRAFT_212213 [Capitella teleta]|uniref:Uncharacterized protein n=1 Tax=Capitella teleta TaxID=283909 RepID=R7VCV2_CAPTE|nr:hypothetical protein CAPTEDRAFT_212213 [Capitella teleta]|eukprot:ELU16469.1 hypothetical protein CAPTEDRAFT_212213 [Capitella teleta]